MGTAVCGTAEIEVSTDAGHVWEAMKDFGNLEWAQGTAEYSVVGDGIGMVRSVRLEDSEEWLDERLLAVDESARRFEYAIDAGMAGVDNYRAAGQAIPVDGGCLIRWQCSGSVEPTSAAEMQSLVEALAEGIAGLFAARFQ